jgi:hypothetical protein
MAALSNQVHNRPVVFAPLQQVNSQSDQLPTTQPTAQKNGQKRSVTLTFERLGSWRLPETASLLGR